MRAGYASAPVTSPHSFTVMSTVIVRRTSSGRSEHTSFDSFSGNMGMTRSTKYVLVARFRASTSTAEPQGT